MQKPTRKTSPADRRRYWQEMNRRYEAAGISMKQFCAAEGISFNGFQYWRYVGSAERQKLSTDPKSLPPENALIPVTVRESADAAAIEITSRNGLTVKVGSSATVELVTAILKSLSAH